jgi:hypothetical protein
MVLGMSLATFTTFHTILSLIELAAGVLVVVDMLNGRIRAGWTLVFLVSAVATDVTGFLFPSHLKPSHVVGVISLIVLTIAWLALYAYHLVRSWRWVFVASVLFALWLDAFVAVAQAFLKIPALNALAPKGNEPAFVVAQLVTVALFVVLGLAALKRFHPMGARPAIG